jgi:hypothetical protein
MRAFHAASLALFAGFLGQPAAAAERFFAYNMTTSDIFTGVYAAPAGSTKWGPNQALNDKDHALDPSERLRIDGLEPGRYDFRIVWKDKAGHAHECVKHDVALGADKSFDVRDDDLAACR